MAVSVRASHKGLEIVDKARKKKNWTKRAATWCQEALVGEAALKKFWQRIPIVQENFERICKAVGIESWEEIVDESPAQPKAPLADFFAYDDAWVGRERLINDLSDRLRVSCRVLILVGITGIGKTALAERLAVELEDWFQEDWNKLHRENFDDEEQASDFGSVARRWLQHWGETVTPESAKDTQQLLNRLVKRLRENRYLVLMDSLEKILKGNEEEGWSDFEDAWWERFFQSLLPSESCQSRLILTSQDLPKPLEERGSRYQNFWYCQPLSGLTELEQLNLFQKTGLEVSTESQPYLMRIGTAYEGHPLALRVIAGEIGNKPFYGNVVPYWNTYGHEIEEVEKAIEEAKIQAASANDQWQLDRYTRNLRRKVRSRLENTFNRLKNDVFYAYVLLCEASVYRCPVPEEFWLSHLEDWDLPEDWDEENSQQMLDALRDRYLVEEVIDNNQCLLRQHNLIRSLSIERYKQLDEDDE